MVSSETVYGQLYRKRNASASVLSVMYIPLPPRDQGERRLRAASCPNSSDLSSLETKAGEAFVFLGVPNALSSSASSSKGRTFVPKISDVSSLFENYRNCVHLGHTSTFIITSFFYFHNNLAILTVTQLKHLQIAILMILQKLFYKSIWKVAKLAIDIVFKFKTLVQNYHSLK